MAPVDTRGAAPRMQSATSPIAAAAPRLPAVGCPKRDLPVTHARMRSALTAARFGVCLKRTCRAAQGRIPPAALRGRGPARHIGFAPDDLSAKTARPAGPEPEK